MNTSTQDELYQDSELASFYDLENGWAADYDFCVDLAQNAKSVLDLGCGTGKLATYLARTKQVTAVDPAIAMLDIARTRKGSNKVTWVMGDATTLRLGRKFDLVLLTGHSFQVFLTPDAQLAALRTIAAHLSPTGRFVFDSRNPERRAWESWTNQNTKRSFAHPAYGETEATTEAEYDATTCITTYHTRYKTAERKLEATSRIRFTSKSDLGQWIKQAGLSVDHWYGDWHGQGWTNDTTEIIPVGRLT